VGRVEEDFWGNREGSIDSQDNVVIYCYHSSEAAQCYSMPIGPDSLVPQLEDVVLIVQNLHVTVMVVTCDAVSFVCIDVLM